MSLHLQDSAQCLGCRRLERLGSTIAKLVVDISNSELRQTTFDSRLTEVERRPVCSTPSAISIESVCSTDSLELKVSRLKLENESLHAENTEL